MPEIGPNTRLRVSPFFEKTLAHGVASFSPYNRMLMPDGYGDPDAEYERLTKGVALWDVACERQVEIKGSDAAELVQLLCVRDLSQITDSKGLYVPMCDHRGVLINDPVVLKLADDRFWISIADNAMLMWCRAIAAERGFEAEIFEPDVSPLAVQGPLAENVVASVLGDWVRTLKYFGFARTTLQGMDLIVQRSGYSKQGGFEIYLQDGKRGGALWDIIAEAGKPWNIGPGGPNPSERIESGLLSYGGDTDDSTNPFEARMGKYVDLDIRDDAVGIQALRQIKAEGIKRRLMGIVLDDLPRQRGHWKWFDAHLGDQKIGSMVNGVWSLKFRTMIGFVLIPTEIAIGTRLIIQRDDGPVSGTVCDLPFA